ncbi:restriction endonuclease subunit S [Vibrio genomosp. F10]|uniref:restriction endonuclease subunit S n=1 Tax=Vibrio genomosp. F10 TaxID=723171 RepID=UPI0002E4CE51|nr:restriction endonuclease subunit S [Vibrio genomosp. F10]OEF06032.1 type I restriction endonuclease subunit S [Vibrio genomosp. F10 str. 9ZB36]
MSELPQGWVQCELKQLISISSGKSLTQKKMVEGNTPVFGGNGITGWHNEGNVFKPTIVIGRVGFYCGSIYITPENAWVTDNAFVTSFSENHIEIEFLYWLLKFTDLRQNDSSSAQPVISGQKVYPIKVKLPPQAEQKRIVEKLDEVLAQVDTIKARLDGIPDLLKRFRQSVLASAVSGKLTEDSEFNSYRLEEVCEILNGARKPVSAAKRKDMQGDYPYYGATGIVDYVNGWTHDDRLLLVGEDGANLLSKTKDLAFIVEGKIWVNNHAHVLKHKQDISLDYISIIINSMDISEYVTGSAQPKLTKKALQNLPLAIPNYEEQKEIVRLVDQYFAFADTIEAQVKKAQARVDNLTQSILAKAFRGELVAQDPTDEPADKLLARIAEARKEAEALAKAAKKAEAARKKAEKAKAKG